MQYLLYGQEAVSTIDPRLLLHHDLPQSVSAPVPSDFPDFLPELDLLALSPSENSIDAEVASVFNYGQFMHEGEHKADLNDDEFSSVINWLLD